MLSQSVKMAWESIKSNKMRSFLTMLGIIIGVMALVVLVSLVNGATGAITEEVTALGNDIVSVTVLDDKGAPLRLENLNDITEYDSIKQAAPTGSSQWTAKHGYADASVSVYGTNPAYYDIQGLELDKGRFLKTTDVENASHVAVLSYDAAKELFGGETAIGETFTMNGNSFSVIGTLAEDDSMMSAMMGSSAVYVPYTVQSRLSDQPYVASFSVSAAGNADDAQASVEKYLLQRFSQDEDAYSIMNLSGISDAVSSVTDTLSLLLGGIAAISLIVGGIGIMNIMLVSVTERTKEIGIRKAIGASRRSILLQFLIEALMISLIGCAIGLLLSWIILAIASTFSQTIQFGMSANVVVLAVAFSSAIGLIFGLYPANKAAKKPPIEALRYDG